MVPELQGDINYSAITYGNCQFVIVYGIYLPTIGWALSSPFIPDVPPGQVHELKALLSRVSPGTSRTRNYCFEIR